MTPTEKAIRDYCGHRADWWPSASQVQAMLALAQDQFKPDYNTEAVLVEEMQRMAKQIAEMQDWEAVAADQAMTIAMMLSEQEPVARVSGTYGGRFVYDPINRATILPIGMALYAGPA